MKRSRNILSVLTSAALSACFVFCACENKDTQTTYAFEGFDITEKATGEAGTYYSFETPAVQAEGKSAELSVTVKSGEKTVPHDNKRVYLEAVGEYVVTYTASYNGKTASKTTSLTCKDTVAPVFVNTQNGALRYGAAIALSDCIEARDVSGVKKAEYSVKKEDGSALTAEEFDDKTNTLCITDETVRKVIVSVSATDIYGNAGESGEFTFKFVSDPTYGEYTFTRYAAEEAETGGVSVKTNASNQASVTVGEDEQGGYVSVSVTTADVNQYVYVQLDGAVTGDFSAFDYVEAEMCLECDGNGGNGGLAGAEFTARPVDGLGNVIANVFTAHKGEWFTYRYEGEAAKQSVKSNQGVYLLFKLWSAQNATIKIRSVKGGYAEKTAEQGEAFDFSVLGLCAEEVQSAAFNGTAVEDIGAFRIKQSGTLTITVNKAGYKSATFNVAVRMITVPVETSENDNDAVWQW
ncbi:MAG: hypothetical protein ACI4RO_01005 [Candidatus Scatosoma sp.]